MFIGYQGPWPCRTCGSSNPLEPFETEILGNKCTVTPAARFDSTLEADSGDFYTDELPTETGWYFHENGHGDEEIVFLDFSPLGGYEVLKARGDSIYLSDDKGRFGPRIQLPSEAE